MPMNERKLSDIRINYARSELRESDVGDNPFDFFARWMEEAIESELVEPTAMTLSTVSETGAPSSRIVLLKGMENGVFKFYTNYDSAKGREIRNNPQASLLFFWAELERQVRVDGSLEKLSRDESNAYFQSRPRESRIGAYTSLQSSVIGGRDVLEKKYEELTKKFENTDSIPLPENWGGYGLTPNSVEFWQGRPSRLHDRIRMRREKGTWIKERLSP